MAWRVDWAGLRLDSDYSDIARLITSHGLSTPQAASCPELIRSYVVSSSDLFASLVTGEGDGQVDRGTAPGRWLPMNALVKLLVPDCQIR